MRRRRKSTALLPDPARKRQCVICHVLVRRDALDKSGRCESCAAQLPLPLKIGHYPTGH